MTPRLGNVGVVCGLLLAGCAALQAHPQPPRLAETLQQIAPHADRDHFVYVWQRVEAGQVIASGIQVEHVSALGEGEFEVLLSEDGTAVARTRFRDTGSSLLLEREEDLIRSLRLTYDPPLPQLTAPVIPGEQRASASVSLARLEDSQVVGVFPAQQEVRVSPGPAVRFAFGNFGHSVLVQVSRTLQMPEESAELKSETLLVDAIGEVRSTGSASATQLLRRELVCAIIGGKRVGDCTDLIRRRDQSGPAPDQP